MFENRALAICFREGVSSLGEVALTLVHSRMCGWLFTVASGVEGSEGVDRHLACRTRLTAGCGWKDAAEGGGAGEKSWEMTKFCFRLFESTTVPIDASTKKTSYFPKINRSEEKVSESVLYFDRYLRKRVVTEIQFNAVDS